MNNPFRNNIIMKQKFIFTLVLVLSLSSHTFGQCKDTLKWEICENVDRSSGGFDDINGKVYNIKDTAYIALMFCITNVSNEIYAGGTIIKFSFKIYKSDTIYMNESIQHQLKRNYNPTDSLGIVIMGEDFILNGLPLGTYYLESKIDETSIDGEFCDTIKILSSKISTFELINTNSINSYTKNLIKIFPNPTSLQLNFYSKTPIKEILINNLMGQQVKHIPVNSNETTLDVSTLPAGMYIAKINTEQGVLTRKVQIIR
jgi:hypothetical protein